MGHTKTAISLPTDLFERLMASAQAGGTTRSAIVAEALHAHFERERSADFIARMNEAWGDEGSTDEERSELEALRRSTERAARRISEMLREDEDEPWQT